MDPRRGGTWNPLQEQAEQLAAELPPLLVAAERLASSVSLGVHGRRKAGMGESFWQFRRYAQQDPSSAIDWRQSAKSQHLFVREREWEAAQAVWFWRDGSRTMRYRSQFAEMTKIDRATLLALALGSLFVRGGERIALLGDGHAPALGRAALRRIAHELSQAPPDDDTLPPDAPITRDSQFVWLSDFLSHTSATEAAMQRFANSGVSGTLVHIVDPAEEDFPFEGRTRFDSLTNSDHELFGRAETVQESYRTRFRAHGEEVQAVVRKLGWSYLAHRTDRRPETVLIALYGEIGGEPVQRSLT